MYKIVITLCLFISAIANAEDFNLLQRMHISFNKTFASAVDKLNTEKEISINNIDSFISEIMLKYPFLLKSTVESEDVKIVIEASPSSGSTHYEIDNNSKPADECFEFLKNLSNTKKPKVVECSESHLKMVLDNRQNLVDILDATLKKLEEYKAESIKCDHNATTIVGNMIDANCVRLVTLKISEAEVEAIKEFLTTVRFASKMSDTWTRNIIDCIAGNEVPSISFKYLKTCGSRFDGTSNSIEHNQR